MKLMTGPARVASGGRLALLAVGLVVVCGACAKETRAPAVVALAGPKPTHAPPFKLTPALITQRKADFMNHVTRDLIFDSGPAADDRRLLKGLPNALLVGPHAILAPEAGATQLDPTLESWIGEGRVLAKITIDEDYNQLHLKKGLNYVCVRRTEEANQWGHDWAVLVSVANNAVKDTASLPLIIKNKTGPARWFVGATDDNFCFPCDSKYCCTGT